MIIEQDEQEARDSFALSVNAEMRDLRLAEANIWSAGPFDLAMAEAGMKTEVGFRPAGLKFLEGLLIVNLAFQFRILLARKSDDDNSDSNEIVKILCRFDIEYDLREEFRPSEAQMKAFHGGNAVFNCWPFFREFVHNAVVRLHFPPPTVPFLRLMPKRTPQVVSSKVSRKVSQAPTPKKIRAKER